jgi:hypothetical protein
MSTVVGRVEERLQVDHPSVHLQLRCATAEQACALRDADEICAVAVLDVTEGDERLAIFAGRLWGARVPCIVVCHADQKDVSRRFGLNNPDLVTYASMEQLFISDSVLQQELLRAVPEARIHEELIYRFWFPRETSTIWVVCPQIHKPGEFADRSSPDYTYLDNLGDTDALLDVMVFLSQYYPNATIERFSSKDLPEGHTSSNLVVIGGPGSAEISNEICTEMMSAMSSHVAYSSDCEQMMVTAAAGQAVALRAEYRPNGESAGHQTPLGMRAVSGYLARVKFFVAGCLGWRRVLRADWGYFARFKNPLNENATVVLINGIHTAGVLGAARAFCDRREALRNFHSALTSDVGTTNFESYFKVPVLNGQVKVPVIDSRTIFTLGRVEEAVAQTLVSTHQRTPVADGRTSLRILFIMGDRGGSQINQIQPHKEYHAIQDALHACKHRDVIALSNPILGATRERLALAYRERPTVVHFAGHGDDRSLSIIDDHGLLANETPLDANQLCNMLRTMTEPVRLFVLNACASLELAKQLVDTGVVGSAVGWHAKVSDSAAIAFSSAFYAALGDGRSLGESVNLGRLACGTMDEPVLVATDPSDTDVLVVRQGDEP